MSASPEGVVRFYYGRGTDEQCIKEGEYALNWTRQFYHRVVANPMRRDSAGPGLQPGDFPAQAVPAQGGQPLVIADVLPTCFVVNAASAGSYRGCRLPTPVRLSNGRRTGRDHGTHPAVALNCRLRGVQVLGPSDRDHNRNLR